MGYCMCIIHCTLHVETSPSTSYNLTSSLLVIGKTEGLDDDWHGHVTALTVDPQYRRLGLADLLMEKLENISDKCVALPCASFS